MVLQHSCSIPFLSSSTLLFLAMKGSLLNNSALFCLHLPIPAHIHRENVSLSKALVYSLNTISHWYTICHHQAVRAKSLFWQRFYTTESKLKGSYQQTHTWESLTLSLWRVLSYSQHQPQGWETQASEGLHGTHTSQSPNHHLTSPSSLPTPSSSSWD